MARMGGVIMGFDPVSFAMGAKSGGGGGGSGGGVLVVHDVEGTLDKTWQEICDAMLSGGAVVAFENPTSVKVIAEVFNNAMGYCVVFGEMFYASETSDGYPTNQDQ